MKELLGKTLTGIFVSNDQQYLKFTTTSGDVCYVAEGDCCSETWFADILFSFYRLKDIKEAEVLEVEVIAMPEWMDRLASRDGRGRQEYDQVYGYNLKFKFGKGITILYRNSSNGYYGGWCEYANENSYYLKELEKASWREITEDWSA